MTPTWLPMAWAMPGWLLRWAVWCIEDACLCWDCDEDTEEAA